jgi:Nitrate and nitrite sensing/Histidine kinase-, DNA gyrase B-, and HSP90-like ATPase/HAMP domain
MIRNLSVRSKLIGILIAPLLALTLLTSLGIGANLAVKVEAERLRQEAAFVKSLSGAVHELQAERDLSAGWVSGGRASGPSWPRRATLDGQQTRVNEALKVLRNDTQALEDDGSAFYRQAQSAQAGFSGLTELRQKVEDNTPVTTADDVLDSYTELIGKLLAVNFEIARNADNHTLTRSVATFVAMARLKEAASQERGFLHAVTAAKEFAPGQPQRLSELVGEQESWRSQFNVAATPEQHDALDQTLQRADSQQATEFRSSLLGTSPGQLTTTTTPNQPITIDPADWYRASTARIELLGGIEEDLAGNVDAAAAAVEAGGSRRALIYTVILTVLLWLTVGLVLLMARSMVQPLRILTDTANEVAEHELPGLVEQLQHARDPRDLDVVPEPVPVTSTDEIGQVSAAFNSVHSTAIQVATEQAALRRSVGDMFLNLARRSQSLIDRQLELMDDLEREETDPETLENLFRLDHLATRMRRNSEDLIVLSGEAPPRRWSQPMPLLEVVRAAVAEVEDYNRVELLPIDESVSLAGQAVSDVVHLLAELVENATSFSPPGTKVQVAGQAISAGYVIEIEDRGLGMSDDELVEANHRLANPPVVDFALSRMLGLYVVARLAQRYNIKVQLRHSWYGGITALVLLPPSVTVQTPVPEALPAAHSGRHQWPELVPPTRPSSDGAGGQVAAPAAAPAAAREAGDGQSGEQHLPIFEAARSDWFDEPDPHQDHLPLRRHGAEQETTAVEPAWWDGAAEAEPSSAATAEPQQQPPPPSVAESPRTPPPAPSPGPPPVARHLRAEDQRPTSAANPPPVPVTRAGLPRRVPRANMAPGMLAEQEPPAPVDLDRPPATDLPPTARARSPEEVRSMLSSYRSGVERGRIQADPDPAAELPRSSRSDDAPSQ